MPDPRKPLQTGQNVAQALQAPPGDQPFNFVMPMPSGQVPNAPIMRLLAQNPGLLAAMLRLR